MNVNTDAPAGPATAVVHPEPREIKVDLNAANLDKAFGQTEWKNKQNSNFAPEGHQDWKNRAAAPDAMAASPGTPIKMQAQETTAPAPVQMERNDSLVGQYAPSPTTPGSVDKPMTSAMINQPAEVETPAMIREAESPLGTEEKMILTDAI